MVNIILSFFKNNKANALALALFTLLSIVMTYPLILHMNNSLSMGDPALNAWALAWDVHSVLTNPLGLFNANIFYPDTSNTLAFSENMIGDMIFAFPVILLTNNPILAYNIIFIISFILSGFGIFLLVDHYIDDKRSAFLAGAAFAFCAFRMAHFGHLQLLTVEWIPFALLFADKFLKKPDNTNAFFLYLFVVLQILSSWYLAFYLSITLALYALFMMAFDQDVKKRLFDISFLARGGLLIVLTVLTVLPFTLPYIQLNQMRGFIRDLGQVSIYSANLSDYLSTPWYPFISNLLFHTNLQVETLSEHRLFPGLVIIGLSIIAFLPIYLKKGRFSDFSESSIKYFYLILAVIAFILSLGTPLHLLGYTIDLNMPYYYLYKYFPGFGSMRVPARFGVIVLISLCVLAGFGMKKVLSSLRDKAKTICVAILVIIVLAESFPTFADNYTMPAGSDVPETYRWLANQTDDISILELPIKDIYINTQYMYFSAYHWKMLVNGYSGFFPPNYGDLINLANDFPSPESVELLRQYNVTYVILHTDYLNATQWSIQKSKIDNSTNVKLEKVIGNDYLYSVNGSRHEYDLSFAMDSPSQSAQPVRLQNSMHYTSVLSVSTDDGYPRVSLPYDNVTLIESLVEGDDNPIETSRQLYFLPLVIDNKSSLTFDLVTPEKAGNYTIYINITHCNVQAALLTLNLTVQNNIITFNPGEGAYTVEFWDNTPTQWMENSTHITIYSDSDCNASLMFRAMSFTGPRTLQVMLNGHEIYRDTIRTSFTDIAIPITLKRGQNDFNFISLNGSASPKEIYASSSEDTRPLSIAYQYMHIDKIIVES